jgi:DNA polymerase-1
MYLYLRTPSEVERLAKQLLVEPEIAFDTETTGLDPHTDKVVLVSISTREKTYLIDTQDVRCLLALKEPLEREDIAKIGVYLFFDYSMVKGTCGIEVEGLKCLHLGEKLLGAGVQWDGFSLEAITKKYLGKERDKSLQKSFIGHKGEFTLDQLQYAAEDTSDLFPLHDAMNKEIIAQGITKAWEIENNVIPAFADIYFHGLKIDEPAWRKIMDDNYKKMKEAESNLGTFFEPFFDRDLFGNLDINYASQPTILYGLQRMGIKVDGAKISDTNDATRKKIGHLPVIKALDYYREAQKALGTYGQPYLDAIHPTTGRIHPRIDQLGTDTGRPTCPKPNILNVPREKRFRHAFVTDFGRLISTVDFSGAELRILADRSGDPLMVEGFNRGVDFHCYVASMLFNREVLKDDPIRTPTKTLNFGLAYGMGPAKLYAKLNAEGHKVTLEECQELFRRYKETFKVAIKYLDANKKLGRKNLEMINVIGRKRRWTAPNFYKAQAAVKLEFLGKKNLNKDLSIQEETKINQLAHEKVKMQWAAIERESANFDIQSTNVEWTKVSMAEMRREFKRRNYDVRFYNSVYDETVLDAAKKDAQEVHELQKKIMIECGQRYCSRVPVTVEGHLVPYWTK